MKERDLSRNEGQSHTMKVGQWTYKHFQDNGRHTHGQNAADDRYEEKLQLGDRPHQNTERDHVRSREYKLEGPVRWNDVRG